MNTNTATRTSDLLHVQWQGRAAQDAGASASASFFSVDGGAAMSGMTTRSRRSQGPPQPDYDTPPPPSGAVLSPTPKQQGSGAGATSGGTRTGLLPTKDCD